MRQLAGAISAEVRVDDRLAILDGGGDRIDDGGRDELVGLAALVRGLDGFRRRLGMLVRLCVDDGVVAALDAVPAVIAVHREVAAADGRDEGVRMRGGETLLEDADEAERRRGRRVPAVEQRVDADARDALATRELRKGDQMPVVGMNAARPDEADEMERAATVASTRRGLEERRAREERTVGDRRVDPWQILEDGTPGAEVEVADLRVAHLPGWQPDRILRGAQDGVWPSREEAAPRRHGCGSDSVGTWVGADAEAIEDDEDDRPRSTTIRGGR